MDLGDEERLNYRRILKVDWIDCACDLDAGGHPSCVHSLWFRPARSSLDVQLVAVTLGTIKRYRLTAYTLSLPCNFFILGYLIFIVEGCLLQVGATLMLCLLLCIASSSGWEVR